MADHTKIESFSEDIEVDSVSDPDFGLMYRVWKSWELLGTFYHALDGKWVAQPCESDARETRSHEDSVRAAALRGNLPEKSAGESTLVTELFPQTCLQISRPRCETAYQAQLLILQSSGDRIFCPRDFAAMAGMLVAGEIEEDLEIPFFSLIFLALFNKE